MTPSELYNLNRTMSCEEIAQMEGVTKNSIVGKIYRYRQRMGLPPASDRAPFESVNIPAKVKRTQKERRKVQKAVIKKPVKRKAVEMPEHKTLADLGAKECRYPYGDKTPYTFCGCPQKEGSVYCEEHYELCRGGQSRKQWHEKKFGTIK